MHSIKRIIQCHMIVSVIIYAETWINENIEALSFMIQQ